MSETKKRTLDSFFVPAQKKKKLDDITAAASEDQTPSIVQVNNRYAVF